MKAWHFIKNNKRLGYGDNRIVKTNRTYKVQGEIQICGNGMHGSKRIIDALKYANGSIVCRVDITGGIIEDDDKIVGRNRRIIWMRDVTNILHEFACRCAEDDIRLVSEPDPRSIAAIKAKRDWLAEKISDEELATAWEAGGHAAWEAAGHASWEAAGHASWEAAMRAAGYAARDAARREVRREVWEAVKEKQNRQLTAMVCSGRR